MTNQVKNGISLITIPVPIVCVFQGCVVSNTTQVLLRILITACPIFTFFVCAMIQWRSLPPPCFLFQQPSSPGKKFAFFFWRESGRWMGRDWDGGGGGEGGGGESLDY